MRGGIWVLNIFAAIWGAGAIRIAQLPLWLAVVPVAISAALLVWAARQPVGAGSPVEGKHVGRVIGIATAIEGVALFLAANVLINMHQMKLLLPIAAIIVGLHFLPLARWIPVPLYYRTAIALIIVGAAGLLLPAPDRALATGIAAASVLWASGILLVRRGRG